MKRYFLFYCLPVLLYACNSPAPKNENNSDSLAVDSSRAIELIEPEELSVYNKIQPHRSLSEKEANHIIEDGQSIIDFFSFFRAFQFAGDYIPSSA